MSHRPEAAPPAPAAGPVDPRARRALIALCVSVTTSYGVLYYAFPVLAPSISADTGWSLVDVTAAFSAPQVVAALVGPLVGRWLEKTGPRTVMTAAALLAVPAVAGIALAPGIGTFVTAWSLAGAAMAGLFYPPAFAALTTWFGTARTRALTSLTLVAGLASTIFAPLTAALEHSLGWRNAYLVLAVVTLLVVVPLHAWVLTPDWPRTMGTKPSSVGGGVGSIVASRVFLALTAALTLGAFGVYAVVVILVPLLDARGLDPAIAALVLGAGGIGQVLGRLAYGPLERLFSPVVRAATILAACALTTGLFAAVAGPVTALVAVGMVAGMSRGILTLLQATAISDRWGTHHYATLSGLLHTPLMLAIALAPWAGSALAGPLGGYPALFAVLAGVGALGAFAALLTRPVPATDRTPA